MSKRDGSIRPSGWSRPVLGETDFDLAEDADLEEPPAGADAAQCLVDAALDGADAAALLQRLMTETGLAIIVRVPSASWVEPLERAFERMDRGLRIYARDGSSRTIHKADVGNREVGGHLSSGRSVVGIASSVSILPTALAAAADASIEVKTSARVVADAVARFVGVSSPAEHVEGLGSLDFHDLVAAFRVGSTGAEIYARLRKAASRLGQPRGDRLPRLVDAIEYGSAREFGLALGRDYEDYLAGHVDFKEIRGNCIFAGPTGLGKTFFARILARHLGIPLIATSISESFATSAGFLDSVIKSVRDTFARAEACAPCALFWDEIDALPMRASLTDGRSSSWWTPVVTEFLTLLDSAVSGDRPGVFVWAATNHPHRVDPALARPGRLDRTIHFAEPDAAGIASILRHQLEGQLSQVDLAPLAQIAIGRSPAELAGAVSRAKSVARQARRPLGYDDLVEAMAPRASWDADTLRRIAVHEAGHAIVCLTLGIDEVALVDLVGSAGALGRTVTRRRAGVETRPTIEQRVCAELGGRAAEVVIYAGDCSANAASDLAAATTAIAGLHASTGLGAGLAYLGDEHAAAALLRVDRNLRDAVNADLARLQARAVDIVRARRGSLEALAEALIDRRHLTGDEVRAIVANAPG
ncbi:AAA family ATPase [Bradyrhizobium sp. BR 10289]|uniref:AAA family ATPase n=1 Tax=Bradyrhizobium sp. BR 10289 TaxID=2749993 RepID=UPI001C64B291|nr:AAA family ATPase [Bradyrhizobium sp. BR 10289]MBW7973547.1 AAA family ATPase [Bradyrhizobium sp. BR 10289]